MRRSRLLPWVPVAVTIAAAVVLPSWWLLPPVVAAFAVAGAAEGARGPLSAARCGAWLRRWVERAVSRLPYFPDPEARCPAHGARFCSPCARNIGPCLAGGGCEYAADAGMHWDTCEHRVRGRVSV
jgi:hypothetical protein